jgi:hypothetical protein
MLLREMRYDGRRKNGRSDRKTRSGTTGKEPTISIHPPEDHPAGEAPEIQEPSDSTEDDGLILWMLSLTPTQRLEVAQGFVDSIRVLRNGRRVRD